MGQPIPAAASRSAATLQADAWCPVARRLLQDLCGDWPCAAGTLDGLISAVRVRRFAQAQVLGITGDRPSDLGILLDGLIEESSTLPDGRKQLVAILGPGDMTGLPSLMDQGGVSHDSCAKTSCTMALIAFDDVRRLMRADGELCMALARYLSRINRRLESRLAAQGKMPLESRVSVMLQSLSERHGLPGDDGIRIDLKLSQADLADWVGVSRQRLNEALKSLENERIISLRYSALTVIDPVRLRHRARH